MLQFHHIETALSANPSIKLPDDGSKRGAVIMPIYEKDSQLFMLFTKRTETLSHHKGQISFPGGKQDKNDPSLFATGLREAYEEIGLDASHFQLIGELNQIKTGSSNILLSTFVCKLIYPFKVTINEKEVQEIIEVPLEALINKDKWEKGRIKTEEQDVVAWFFDFDPHVIWGATAKLVQLLLKLL
ncbi:MAG: NUDIX hydrolase [Candidatus Heimdallarchaeota archaeon]